MRNLNNSSIMMHIEQAGISELTPKSHFFRLLHSCRPLTVNNHSITFDGCWTMSRASRVDQNAFKNVVHQAGCFNALWQTFSGDLHRVAALKPQRMEQL